MTSYLIEWLDMMVRYALAPVIGFLTGAALQEFRVRRMRKRLRRLATETGTREVVLIVSNRQDIRPDVEIYLQSQNKQRLTIFEVFRRESFSADPEEWYAFVDEVRANLTKLRKLAPNRILFFTNVPVAMGVALGALLDNGPRVIVHHYFDGHYHPVIPLSHENVAPREELEPIPASEEVVRNLAAGATEQLGSSARSIVQNS
jgi:hypothetical protein